MFTDLMVGMFMPKLILLCTLNMYRFLHVSHASIKNKNKNIYMKQ